jgi:F-type H+-transporting ATPase subunit b
MSLFAASALVAVLAQEEEEGHHLIDRTPSWIWPESYEIWFGGFAILFIVGLLYWKAFPALQKGFRARTERIQKEIDDAAAAVASAEQESARIRSAKGDIAAERARILADADRQAEQLVADGRTRLAAEVEDLEAKADAEIAQLAARSGDELRAEIARLAGDAAERVVADSLDDATQQNLIEAFIARAGATR